MDEFSLIENQYKIYQDLIKEEYITCAVLVNQN